MRIAVCVKQVPDTEARLRVAKDGRWIDEEDLPFVINESDEYALEEALRIVEKRGGEVVVFSLGPERTREALRKALALGAASAVFLSHADFQGGDALATGRALATAIAKEPFDLVLAGSQSDDQGFGATGTVIAGQLGWPHAWLVMGVEVEESGSSVRVVREMEAGMNEVIRLVLPAVLEVQAGLNHPRYASLKGIMAAKKKPVSEPTPADLGLDPATIGAAGSRIELVSVGFPESGASAQVFEGDPVAAAATLISKLRTEARVILVTMIWAVAQHRDGKLHRGSFEAVAAAQRLAEATGGVAQAIVVGSGVAALAQELASSELGAVRVVDHPALSSYTPGGYVAALAPAIVAGKPEFVLFPHSYQSCEYVPRLAQATGAAHLPEAIGFEGDASTLTFKRPILEGKLHARVRIRGGGTALVTLQSGAFSADSRRAGSAPIEPLGVELASVALGREILGVEQAGGDTVDLTKAQAIVSVGRGVGGADKLGPIEELAKLLQAEIGASRPVIDSGWLPRDRQIGSSGQTVAPKLYLALGISGAIQHLVGMKGSSCVVAVNKDVSAPIFKIAQYGIVGDLHEVVPAMIKALREQAGG